MAIKKISFKGNDILDEGEINFINSNIISIVGMNGSGKSLLMKYLKENLSQIDFKKIVHKKDIEDIEKYLNPMFKIGKNALKFQKIINEIKKDNLKDEKEVKAKFHEFIWDRFLDSSKNLIKNNYSQSDSKEMIAKIENLKKQEIFSKSAIEDNIPNITKYIIIDSYDEHSKKLEEVWNKKFNNPKIVSINNNQNPNLNGDIFRNGLNEYSIAESLRKKQNLFVRLLNIAKINDKIYKEIINNDLDLNEEQNNKINDWLKGYISQDLTVKLLINRYNYSIEFYEYDNQIDFDKLSSGTQNLLNIMSQIGKLNSSTIIQIDEPETGMHPIMQIQFRNFLEDLSKKYGARFLIYTHSTHIVKEGFSTKGLYVMVRENGISKIYSKDNYVLKENILDFQIFNNIGFESYENNFKFDKNKKMIIVEGDTDVIYIKKMIKLFDFVQKIDVCRTKLGGATTMLQTSILLEAIHNFERKKIIFSPDLDIVEKFKKEYEEIKKRNFFPLGNNEKKQIEGFFVGVDKKFICSMSANNNTKMNKASFFWRSVVKKNDLCEETIKNFENYFKKVLELKK